MALIINIPEGEHTDAAADRGVRTVFASHYEPTCGGSGPTECVFSFCTLCDNNKKLDATLKYSWTAEILNVAYPSIE